MFMYYNAHPKNLLVGDCVKRAITVATGMDYMEVQRELNRYKKITGAKDFNSDYNPHKYVENVLHGVKLSFPAQKGKPRMNGERFCKQYPNGRYILNMAGHWSCCVDGVILDTWDTSEKCVYTAYQVEKVHLKNFTINDDKKNPVTLTVVDGDTVQTFSVKQECKNGYLQCLKDLGYTKKEN